MFLESLHSLPFVITELYSGLATVQGLVSLEQDDLILEFQIKDGLVGVLKSQVREVRVPLRELEAITLEKKWLSLGLVLKAYRIRTLLDIPSSEAGRVVLKLTKRDEAVAIQLVNHVQVKLSEHRFDRAVR